MSELDPKATSTAEGRMPIELLQQFLASFMGLKDDRVFIYGERFKIPADDGLFVVVELKYAKQISARNEEELQSDASMISVQHINTQERYIVGVFSRDLSALRRHQEVPFALASIACQQLQEQNSFKISRINPAQDLTALEASAELRRFDIEVVVLASYELRKAIEYYNSYAVRVVTDEGQARNFTQQTGD